jgi:hypothetical protein
MVHQILAYYIRVAMVKLSPPLKWY